MPEFDMAGWVDGGRLLGLARVRRVGYTHPVPLTEIAMAETLLTELEKIRALVHADGLAPDDLKTVIWCLGCLPGLYSEFLRTYESRYGDEIHRLVDGLLAKLDKAALKQAILSQLLAMHERLGIPALNFAPRKRKAG
jgi:hypothetical protein